MTENEVLKLKQENEELRTFIENILLIYKYPNWEEVDKMLIMIDLIRTKAKDILK